jgi:hypothetical protein
MADELANDRAYALTLARRYFYERNVGVDTLVQTFANTTDPLIARVLDLIAREPPRDGAFLTVSQKDYEKNYWPFVAEVLRELERGEAGIVPPEYRTPARRVFWTMMVLLFVLGSAAENLGKFIAHVSGTRQEAVPAAAAHLGVGMFMFIISIILVRVLMAQLRSRRAKTVSESP